MEELYLGAWDLMGVLEANFGADRSCMLGFFQASSPFYRMLDDFLRRRVLEKFSVEDEEELDDPEAI